MKKTCGLDVHKDTIFCSIYNGKNFRTKHKKALVYNINFITL